jgi:hypothetical protein
MTLAVLQRRHSRILLEDAIEVRHAIFPVPVTAVIGQSYVECQQPEFVYRVINHPRSLGFLVCKRTNNFRDEQLFIVFF